MLDEELVRRAETIAASRNMPVEAYLERLLRVVTQPPPRDDELGPIGRRLAGALPSMTDEEVRDAVYESMAEKYGRE